MANKEKEPKNKKRFFKDFKAELKKVIWPTPKQLVNNTAAVVVIVIITAAIVFALDFAFEALNKYGINPVKSKVRGTDTVVEQNIDESNNAEENTEANNDVQNVNGTVVENNSAENSNEEVANNINE